jgi:iron(III) transport system substrate-binding protein
MRSIVEKSIISLILPLLLTVWFALFSGCQRTDKQVVIYTSLDQTFSEPILELFEQRTGIEVKAVYDIEAAKTIGLVNRLVAERSNPQADVFWSSEIVQTIYLKKEHVLAPYTSSSAKDIPDAFKDKDGFWTGFASRARVIAYDPERVDPEEVPSTIRGLADSKWKEQVAIANPLFGTTSTHAAVLFSHLGKEKASELFNVFRENSAMVVSGNAHARDMVLMGVVKLCLTDTDDVVSAQDRGESIEMVFPDNEGMGTLLIPNTIALIKDGPNAEQGKQLIDFILSRDVEQLLANSSSAQLPVRSGISPREEVAAITSVKIMHVDFEKAYEHIVQANDFIKNQFLSP